MTQLERIGKMEQALDRLNLSLRHLSDALDEYESTSDALRELSAYYGSQEWRQDFEADEAGELPPQLKRGVLSEDGIWSALEKRKELTNRMHDLAANAVN